MGITKNPLFNEDAIAFQDGSQIACVECGEKFIEIYPEAKALTPDDFEEDDIALRLIKRGYKLYVIDRTVIIHTPGKGSAFKTIFEIARKLEARVCVVSDADTRSIHPEWTYALVEPVLGKGFGYVNPYYSRDKHDGTITNSLVYPMTRMLYGLRIRKQIGGDFAFSKKLVKCV